MSIIYAYTDGSCLNNQGSRKGNSFGGYGCRIDYPNGLFEEFSNGIAGKKITNNIGELMALKKVLERLLILGVRDIIHVYSDSMYVINTYTRDIKNWEANEWKKANGKPVENLELIQEIYTLMQESNLVIIFKKWKAHGPEPSKTDPSWKHWNGNRIADALAVNCATDMMNEHNEKVKQELLTKAKLKKSKKRIS